MSQSPGPSVRCESTLHGSHATSTFGFSLAANHSVPSSQWETGGIPCHQGQRVRWTVSPGREAFADLPAPRVAMRDSRKYGVLALADGIRLAQPPVARRVNSGVPTIGSGGPPFDEATEQRSVVVALIVVLTVLVGMLTILVAGLLRSHADILARTAFARGRRGRPRN